MTVDNDTAPDAAPNMPTMNVLPAVALIDVPRNIILQGFPPLSQVDITATYVAADSSNWSSHARFLTDANGTLDLNRDAPTDGAYEGADPNGLIWSLALQSGHSFAKGDENTATRVIHLHARNTSGASGASGISADATLKQHFIAPGVTREVLDVAGLRGTVFLPQSDAPCPVVVVLNGSGGGINEARAALYAAHGYIGVALGYFNAPGLPAYISDTRLEAFQEALSYIEQRYKPPKRFIALQGHSRGAELSLLLATLFPDAVSAVLAYVPSHVVHGTLRAGRPGQNPQDPAWLLNNAPLPTVWENNASANWKAFNSRMSPVRQSPSFESALGDTAAVARAAIAVERIKGPVLLVSGTDDGFWPSSHMADAIVQRRNAHDHPAAPLETTHLRYEGAGHAIQYPFVPTTRIVRPHAVAGVDLTGGGNAAANAFANADSWPRALDFLEKAFAKRGQA